MEEFPASLVSQIAQDGIFLEARAGCSLRAFLSGECCISPEYIDNRISTIFLDSSPVDDIDSAMIKDGSIIALSAAMPGLVGAAMRRGGAYAAIRSSITHAEKEEYCRQGTVIVRLKLFNMVLKELGPGFFEKGVYVKCHDLARSLAEQTDDFWEKCKELIINGEQIECLRLRRGHYDFNCETALLTITVSGLSHTVP